MLRDVRIVRLGRVCVKRKLAVVLLLVLALAAFGLPVTTPAAAQPVPPIQVCYVEIHIHVFPGAVVDIPNGVIRVETGEYHPHQNCVTVGAWS